jgi:MerR family transcriptional regulator/heat shock protein HspR
MRQYLTEKGLNIAGIKALLSLVPCWALRPCSVNDRENCDAYHSSSFPCWEAANKGPKCKNTDCRICKVYRFPEQCDDVKSLFKKMII